MLIDVKLKKINYINVVNLNVYHIFVNNMKNINIIVLVVKKHIV